MKSGQHCELYLYDCLLWLKSAAASGTRGALPAPPRSQHTLRARIDLVVALAAAALSCVAPHKNKQSATPLDRDVLRTRARRRRIGHKSALAQMVVGLETRSVARRHIATGRSPKRSLRGDGVDGAPFYVALRGRIYESRRARPSTPGQAVPPLRRPRREPRFRDRLRH